MTWIYGIPVWVFSLCTVVALCTITCVGHWLVLRSVPTRDFVKHNGVAGSILGIIGTAYAVLLSFVVVVVWQQYNNSDNVVSTEASAVSDLHRLSDALPSPLNVTLKTELDRYVSLMIYDEWPQMQHGGWSREAQHLARVITRQVADVVPRNASQQNVQSQALGLVTTFLDARRGRLHDNETGIPWILWSTLWCVAVVTLAFSYMFGVENVRIQLTMTGALTLTIALMFILIAELDYPFRGDTGISPHSWYQIQRQLHSDR